LDHETQIFLAGENSITNGWAERRFGNEPDTILVNLLHVRGTGETERSGKVLAIGAFSTMKPVGFPGFPLVEKEPPICEPVWNVPIQKRKTNQYIRP
jgi:hypothetical protein